MKINSWKNIIGKRVENTPAISTKKKAGLVKRDFRGSRYIIALDDISESDLFDTYSVLKKANRQVRSHSKDGRFIMEVKKTDKTALRLTASTM